MQDLTLQLTNDSKTWRKMVVDSISRSRLRLKRPDDAGPIVLQQSFEGVVTRVEDDEALVVYHGKAGRIEQVYAAEQFVEGRLPELGDRVTACVTLRKSEATSSGTITPGDAEKLDAIADDFSRYAAKPGDQDI